MPNNAPASTWVMVVGVMATFASFWIVLIFTPSWYWYLIPVAFAIGPLVVLVQRWQARRRMRREVQAAMEELG